MTQAYKSGFIAVIGRPNAGKSTLINRLLGKKVAIVSDKPQTTRNSIRGIYTDDRMQAIFIDTPGVHRPKHKLDERMMDSVTDSLAGCDLVFYLIDVTQRFAPSEDYILRLLSRGKHRVFLILNKIDQVEKPELLPVITELSARYDFSEIIPLSAETGENTENLLSLVERYLPAGPQYYPDDLISDQPDNLLIAELVREQALLLTNEEVPHALAVVVNQIEERDGDLLYIQAVIYVERDSQKGIIIGKQGQMLKKIGSAARTEIERIFACRVYLELRVKAKKDWRNNKGLLDNIFLTDEL